MSSDTLLHAATDCANCATATGGARFCQACGQETALHMPSASEFLHEFVGHYVALEGKLWKTLGLLLFRPGRLTCEYLAGRRVRFVQPLRLYLTLSIIFFALFKLGGHEGVHIGDGKPAAVVAKADAAGAPRPEAGQADSEQASLAGVLGKIHPGLGKRAAKFDALTTDEKNHQLKSAFFSYAPYAVFCLMPVFALLLKLLYLGSGRRYGEHLLFALHSNAFAFLMLSLVLVVPDGLPLVEPALGLWLVFYLPTAMRRVYGGTRLATFLRWMVLGTLHALSIALAILAALGLAIVA